jgi:hypothetical protein
MDQEIASWINSVLLHQKAPAHIKIMNAKKNATGAMTELRHPNATAEMPVHYHDMIRTTARTVDKLVVDVEETESWECVQIQAVPFIKYMGKGTEKL